MHGVDIVTGDDNRHYVLEMNGGGNTWHFSSDAGAPLRANKDSREVMMAQMGAWRIVADTLIERTRLDAR